MPRMLVMTVIATGILYFLIVLAYISVLPDAGSSGATLIDVGRELMGPAGAIMITLAAFFSIGGNLSSIMLAVPRLTFTLAQDGLLPKWSGKVHPKYSTPGNSIIFLGGLGLIFALSGSFAYLAAASSLMRLIAYVLCISALPAIRQKATDEEKADAYRLKGGYAIPGFALLLCLWMGAQSSLLSWQVTGGLVGAGLLLYAVSARTRGRGAAQSDQG
jgi:amino acid transporter